MQKQGRKKINFPTFTHHFPFLFIQLTMLLTIPTSLPFTDPLIVFTIVLLHILFAPIILKKLKMPGIVGLVIAGVIIGPKGFGLLSENSSITLFGKIGLMYLMFLAGLEIDLFDFKKNRKISVVFGTLTFFVPLAMGIVLTYYILNYSLLSSILLSSIFSTHTLLSYPIVSRYGMTKNRAVTATIGGTIITDTAVLLLLTVIASSVSGNLDFYFWTKLLISLFLFVFTILWGAPKISRWFFKNLEGESGSQYIYVLVVVFVSGVIAELAGIEPIIGAFLAGLALNKLIPHTSALMNRISFSGNAFFIPFFLISVGMLVDINILTQGYEIWLLAASLIFIALLSKWTAAMLTRLIFKFTPVEGRLIYGLSSSHAAATIAVILVGYNLGILGSDVLNAIILLIFVTCMVSSFVTENSIRQLIVIQANKKAEAVSFTERILVAIGNPEKIQRMVEFAFFMRDHEEKEAIYPLKVVSDDENAAETIVEQRKLLQVALKKLAVNETEVRFVSRVDFNIANGIARAIKELTINQVVMGWSHKSSTTEYFFGSILDNLLKRTDQMTLVTHLTTSILNYRRFVVLVPSNAELEIGFQRWLKLLRNLSQVINAKVQIMSDSHTIGAVQNGVKTLYPPIQLQYQYFIDWQDFDVLDKILKANDLLIVISARQQTISHHNYLNELPRQLTKYQEQRSFIIVYPEQKIAFGQNLSMGVGGFDEKPIHVDLESFNKFGKTVAHALVWRHEDDKDEL